MPAICVGVLLERALGRGRVVERHRDHQVDELLRQPERLRHRRGVVARAGLVLRREHRHHQRVVVAVIRPLDLQDQLAAGERAHDARGVQRRLGPRVAEPPVRQLEPLREQVGHEQRVLGRLREVRAQRDAFAHGLDDLRMRVAHHHDAVAVVVVDVLVVVDVPDVRALAAPDVDRVRRPGLPRRADPAGEPALRLLAVRQAAAVLHVERRGLVGEQPLDHGHVDLHDVAIGLRRHAHTSETAIRSSRICGERTHDEREVSLVVEEPGLRARDVRGQPLAVRERHHAVLRALPDGDGHADPGKVEAPRVHERDVVVEPAPDARRDRLVEHRRSHARRTRRSGPPRRRARPAHRALPPDRPGSRARACRPASPGTPAGRRRLRTRRSSPRRSRRAMPARKSSPSASQGPTPAVVAHAMTRSGRSAAHASACGRRPTVRS